MAQSQKACKYFEHNLMSQLHDVAMGGRSVNERPKTNGAKAPTHKSGLGLFSCNAEFHGCKA